MDNNVLSNNNIFSNTYGNSLKVGLNGNLFNKAMNIVNDIDLSEKKYNKLKFLSNLKDDYIKNNMISNNSSKESIIKNHKYINENDRIKNGISKATAHNNPGNITGMGGKLLYNAIGIASSNTGDSGDRKQLIYATPEDGFKAMHTLAVRHYSDAPIRIAFNKWQTDKASFFNKLRDLEKYGIDTSKKYTDLNSTDQKLFRKIWSQHEGYRGKFF
jgi:hypothetical protein